MSQLGTEQAFRDDMPATPPRADASTRRDSIELPFAILSVTIAIIFVISTINVWRQRSALKDALGQLTAAYHEREPMVKQSKEVQQTLEKVLRDLVKLSVTDRDAREIVTKYGIQVNDAPSGARAQQ